MPHSIFITSTEAGCGKSLVSLGLIENALRKTSRVSIYKPIITLNNHHKKDNNVDLLLRHFHLNQSYEEVYAFKNEEAQNLLVNGQLDNILDTIIERYKQLEDHSDLIICEGTDFISEGSNFEFRINVELALNLGSPVIIVARGDQHRSINEVIFSVQLAVNQFLEKDCEIVGIIVNRVPLPQRERLIQALRQDFKQFFLAAIPEHPALKSPTIQEIVTHLSAEVLYGADQLHQLALKNIVAAMNLENYLNHVTNQSLIVTPGDRAEIILGTLEAHHSKNYPSISGIVLSGGLQPAPTLTKLLDGLSYQVPILSVPTNTYETIQQLNEIYPNITADHQEKIQLSKQLFRDYVDGAAFEEKISNIAVRGITPRMFQYNLTQQAKSNQKHILLAEGEDERIIKATARLMKMDVVRLSLLGDKNYIEQEFSKLGTDIDVNRLHIIEPKQHPKFQEYVHCLYDLRKHKGITLDQAADLLNDVSYFGTMMVYQSEVDGMISGATHTTQQTIRPALQILKTKVGHSIVSSVFFMCLPDRVLVYGDCAINPNPNAQQLAEIAIASAETASAFGIEPKVAMLSYSSGTSGKGEDVETVRNATKIVRSLHPSLKIEGPIQYDAAVDPNVGRIKLPGSEVAGHATVFIFPDLNTGNNTYKAIQRETGAIAIGPLLQGLTKPVNDLSRGCTVADIVNTVIMTAIQAQSL